MSWRCIGRIGEQTRLGKYGMKKKKLKNRKNVSRMIVDIMYEMPLPSQRKQKVIDNTFTNVLYDISDTLSAIADYNPMYFKYWEKV